MRLNLAILCEDLDIPEENTSISGPCSSFPLKYASAYHRGMRLSSEVLYVVDPSSAKEVPRMHGKGPRAYFLFAGKPQQPFLESPYDVAWMENTSIGQILSLVNERFAFYSEWHLRMESSIARNKPVSALGELAHCVFDRPLWMWDRFCQTVFHLPEGHGHASPDGDFAREDMMTLPPEQASAWQLLLETGTVDLGIENSHSQTFQIPAGTMSADPMLARSVFVGNRYYATISISEVDRAFTDRDEALLTFVADIMQQALRSDTALNASTSFSMNSCLQDLLSNVPLGHTDLRSALASIGWSLRDAYVCIVAHPLDKFIVPGTLVQIAEKITGFERETIYCISNNAIVFIANATKSPIPVQSLVESIAKRFRGSNCSKVALGVSNVYEHFGDTFLYYRQSVKAVSWLLERNPGVSSVTVSRFDDFIMEAIIRNICDHASAEVICPMGLMRLRRHDIEQGTDYIRTLRSYLDCDRNASEAARELFIHRNTLLGKLKKIDQIAEIDFSNPDNRLVVMLALRALEAQDAAEEGDAASGRAKLYFGVSKQSILELSDIGTSRDTV